MTDDDLDAGQDLAMEMAVQALREAPRHAGHRHGLVVGSGIAPESDVPFLVVMVQGLKGPVYVPLDDSDLAVIAAHAAARSVEPDAGGGILAGLAGLAKRRVH